jgi:hypothetical protein
VLLSAMPAPSHSEQAEQDARVAAARKLVEVTGGGRIAVQVSQAILTSMKQQYPKVPDEFWSELAAEFKAEEFVERVVPIYAKYLTVEEMQQLEAFYESPIGQKVLQALPAIMQESVAVGQQWGREVGGKSPEATEGARLRGQDECRLTRARGAWPAWRGISFRR